MSTETTFWGEAPHPQLAQLIATQFFPIPAAYHTATASYVREAMKGGPTDTPYLWDIKTLDSDAQLFYTSQLVPRIALARINGQLNIGEEYAPLHVDRSERVASPEGEAVAFDLETTRAAIDQAVARFGMPDSIKGQRIRYSWVIYGPSGFAAGPPISVLTAASASTPLDSKALLDALNHSTVAR